MTDVEIIEAATEFRDGILEDRSSKMMCAVVSWPLAGMLRFWGLECEEMESDLGDCNHVWIKLSDGRALDPTADQFNDLFALDLPPVYLGKRLSFHV